MGDDTSSNGEIIRGLKGNVDLKPKHHRQLLQADRDLLQARITELEGEVRFWKMQHRAQETIAKAALLGDDANRTRGLMREVNRLANNLASKYGLPAEAIIGPLTGDWFVPEKRREPAPMEEPQESETG